MVPEIATLIRCIIAVPVLAGAAIGYDALIGWLKTNGYLDGYTALAVVVGVSGVLAAALWTVWPLGQAARLAVALTAGLFVPAGVPMLAGSIVRHVRRRTSEQRRLLRDAAETLR